MVSLVKIDMNGVAEYRGLSTDEKPSGNKITNMSAFIEADTSTIYFYNKESEEWIEWGAE